MKIVHIEDFFHPDAGYQVNLLAKLQVQQGHQVTVITSELEKMPVHLTLFFGKMDIRERDKAFSERTGVEIIRVPLIGYYSGRSIFSKEIFEIVRSLCIDAIFIHGEATLTAIQFIWNYDKINKPMIIDSHMLEMASGNRFNKLFNVFYRNFLTPIILKHNIPLIRVVDSDYVEKSLGIPLNKTILLSFGTDTEYFRPNKQVKAEFRKVNGINEDDFVVIYAGKLDIYKGGQFLANSVQEEFQLPLGKKIVFIIVGNTAGDYGMAVEETLLKSKNRIIRFPTQTYFDLLKFYQGADLSIFPKQCSLSFFEAQSCGLPVLFENNEINIERIRFDNGMYFNPEDMNDFRMKIINFAKTDKKKIEEIGQNGRNYILQNYNYVPIAKKFTDIIEKEVFRFKKMKI